MNQDDILAGFREQAERMDQGQPPMRDLILELAQLLADSHGRLSKENFETLNRIGAALYKEGHSRFHGLSDVNAIMDRSTRKPDDE